LSVAPATVGCVIESEQRFATVVDALLAEPGVTPPSGGSGFGRASLRADGRIFAMLVRGDYVVKLPKGRVDELVDAGHGCRFDANKGTPMKEWLRVDPAAALDWSTLAREALAHVR
jgi:hypothetical protein